MNRSTTSLIVGAGGMLGRHLARRLADRGESVVRTTRRPEADAVTLDLSSNVSVWTPPCGVDAAYLCAAVTSIEECRRDPARSLAVNVTGTVNLARTFARQGVHVVFPSTNLVLGGTTPFERSESPRAPSTEYGRQKAEAERQLLALSERICIVRFSKVFGPRTPLLVRWADDLRRGRAVHPFADMVVSPLPVDFAVDVLLRAGRRRIGGLVQASGPGDISYEAIARHLARRVGAPQTLVEPIETSSSGVPFEHVPRHSTLDMTRLREELGLTPPDVWTTIDRVLAE